MRITNLSRHLLERLAIRGAGYQLLLVAALIGLISLIGGALIRGADPAGTTSLGDAVWWAFLRLTDPGYLGDDAGSFRRAVATVITLLGYVLFMGSLVAIMTQWLHATLRRLERGFTPVSHRNHVIILGWTERVGTVVKDLFLSSGRVRRFLSRRGIRSLRLVVLAEDAGADMQAELKSRVGAPWNGNQVTLRSGSALRADHLRRVNFQHAAAIILPADDIYKVGYAQVDTHTIKALLTMSHHPDVNADDTLPLAVAEVLDARKISIAEAAYAGPVEVLAADRVISRLLAQNLRQRGLSQVYTEILTHREGNELFVGDLPALHGRSIQALTPLFKRAIPLGVVRETNGELVAHLPTGRDVTYDPGDRLIVMARDYEHISPKTETTRGESPGARAKVPQAAREVSHRRVLCLGFSYKVPTLLQELAQIGDRQYEVDIVSVKRATEREAQVARHLERPGRLEVRHIEMDYTVPSELATLALHEYDHIILVGSDRTTSEEEADARTIVGYLTLQQRLGVKTPRPHIVVELLDPSNLGLLGKGPVETMVSPLIMSHMLTQVALRRELSAVFEALFAFGGTDICFRGRSAYGYDDTAVTFATFQGDAAARGELALGFVLRREDGSDEVILNPSRDDRRRLGSDDRLVVLAESMAETNIRTSE